MSIADGDTTTLVDGGFATEYCFALHACKMSWVVVLLKEVQLKQDFSSRGLVPEFCRLLRISDPTVLGEGALYRCKMFEMWPLPLYSCTTCASVHDYHVLWQLEELILESLNCTLELQDETAGSNSFDFLGALGLLCPERSKLTQNLLCQFTSSNLRERSANTH